MEDLEPYCNVLKALRDRMRVALTADELEALERAIGMLTADSFTEGALTRTAQNVNQVQRIHSWREARRRGISTED